MRVGISCLEIHQFGDGALHRTVISADYPRRLQLVASVVSTHLHTASHTLTDVDYHLTGGSGILQHFDEPWILGRIATAVCAHHNGAKVGRGKYLSHEIFLYSWEYREHEYARIELESGFHRFVEIRYKDSVLMIVDSHTCISKMSVVEALEGIKLVGTLLGGAVASHEMPVEVDSHFWNHCRTVVLLCRGNLDTRDEILLAVGAQLSYRQLRTGENNWFCKIVEHVAQCRGGVGHSVGTMQYHKSVILGIVVCNDVHEVNP